MTNQDGRYRPPVPCRLRYLPQRSFRHAPRQMSPRRTGTNLQICGLHILFPSLRPDNSPTRSVGIALMDHVILRNWKPFCAILTIYGSRRDPSLPEPLSLMTNAPPWLCPATGGYALSGQKAAPARPSVCAGSSARDFRTRFHTVPASWRAITLKRHGMCRRLAISNSLVKVPPPLLPRCRSRYDGALSNISCPCS